jgi:hypothetical protein
LQSHLQLYLFTSMQTVFVRTLRFVSPGRCFAAVTADFKF